MKIKAKLFEFTSYKFEPKNKRIFFNYKIEFESKKPLLFTETIILPKVPSLKNVPWDLLQNLLHSLHIILGVSYYKIYCPARVKLNKPLAKEQADFWNIVYKKGLGELCYRNKIDPEKIAKFPFDKKIKVKSYELERNDRSLVGMGGGKDSIVAFELLKEQRQKATAFVVETQKTYQITNQVIKKMGIKALKVKRFLDTKIFDNHPDSYNGHIPISAIYAFLGYMSAIFYDYSYVAISNGQSSDYGNLKYKGEEINHQWSKTSEFELMFQKYTYDFICPNVTFYSPIRPFYEIRIVQELVKHKKYLKYFSSCNKGYRIKHDVKKLWCGECPKCAFVFSLLAVFLSKKELLRIFSKDLFNDERLLPIFRDLLGFSKLKPFDCVGPFEETKAALYLVSRKYKNDLVIKKFLLKIKGVDKLVKRVFKAYPAPTMPARFQFLGMKNVLLLGFGKEGEMTYKYIKKKFPKLKIGIADKKFDPNYLEKQKDYDLAVKTPGLSKRFVTMPYITATNIFFSQMKNLIIGVTGTKGKSTTVSLIQAILKEAGRKVFALGNIGRPMLGALLTPIGKNEIFVLELSSYQLDDIKFSPNITVVLNLFPDHLNYHGGMNEYLTAKKNIVNFQKEKDFFVYNSKYRQLSAWAKECRANIIPFDKKSSLRGIESPLIGQHNRDNLRAAIAVAEILKINRSIVKRAVKNFKPLPHRLELIGEFKGIKFYDDAISTTPESTIMAIKSLPKIGTIFLGGEDRGYNFSNLEKTIRKYKIKNVALFPATGRRIFKSKKDLKILQTTSMERAVKFAYNNTLQGQICLLSTASPSYSLWKNFEEKGNEFNKWVSIFGKS